jgi:hypothetical protein
MESSRDSSVWRSLAVTFGGGLALGAVGMKLTQTALWPLEVTPLPDSQPLTGRLDSMERRLERMEQTPVSSRPPATGQPAAAPIDQKVLEAVIGAVDARLHEHAGQVDRRLADLEARFAVEVQTLHRQDRQASEGNQKSLAEMERQLRQEAEALRAALERDLRQVAGSASEAVAGQKAIHAEADSLRQQNERIVDAAEQRFADMRYEYRQAVADLRESVSVTMAGQEAAQQRQAAELRTAVEGSVESHVASRVAALEQSIETRIVTAAAAAAAAQYEERLAPLRAEVQRKERELAELRQRLAESEKSVLDVVLAIGDVCRQAAERMSVSPAPRPGAPPPEPVAVAPAASAPPAPQPATPPPEPVAVAPAAIALPAPPPPAADPTLAQAIPDLLHDSDGTSSWRIPLVSSFVLTTGCLLLLHFL